MTLPSAAADIKNALSALTNWATSPIYLIFFNISILGLNSTSAAAGILILRSKRQLSYLNK